MYKQYRHPQVHVFSSLKTYFHVNYKYSHLFCDMYSVSRFSFSHHSISHRYIHVCGEYIYDNANVKFV